jgi:Rrf2 family protein
MNVERRIKNEECRMKSSAFALELVFPSFFILHSSFCLFSMRISKKSEYALRALIAIARNPKPNQIHDLSKRENIPVKFLEQILLSLRHAGILTSKRGVGGGYSLRKNAGEITVGEVICVMDGPLAPVPCAAVNPNGKCTCPNPRTCALRLLMTEVREELSGLLDHRSIEDVMRLSPDAGALAFEI